MVYDCPYSMNTYILVVKKSLHLPLMEHNLIPSFIMREAGLMVNDVPKIHTKRDVLSVETHCIVANKEDNEIELRIPMQFDGIFSYFPTRKLTEEEIDNCEYIETLQLCPDGDDWDPYDESFAKREDSHTDYRGDLIDCPAKQRRLIEDADVGGINVSAERDKFAISSVVAITHDGIDEVMLGVGNP